MTKPALSLIEQPWPQNGLESVARCPYCNSAERFSAYTDVQDWSFYTAKGKWTYWKCKNCESLYLDPRPTTEMIGLAYGTYYTHKPKAITRILKRVLSYLRNTCWFFWYGLDIKPRIEFPRGFSPILNIFKPLISDPFPLQHILKLKTGKLLDIGCGDGRLLQSAAEIGWEVIGLEMDAKAVTVAKAIGLNVIQGTFEKLQGLNNEFDCVVCSHVLEHVHAPKELLQTCYDCLKADGILLLSLPNANSHALKYFGENWRGLEAPRHLTIPSIENLAMQLRSIGFEIEVFEPSSMETAAESVRIQRRGASVSINDRIKGARLKKLYANKENATNDFIKIRCKKRTAN